MRLALLQCDVTNGEMDANSGKIIAMASRERDADLCVVPAEALNGPEGGCVNCGEVDQVLRRLAEGLKEGPALLCSRPEGAPLLIEAGRILPLEEEFDFHGRRICLRMDPGQASSCDLVINTVSRPFVPHIQADWELVLCGAARMAGRPMISVNLAGGYGGTIYNGESVAVDAKGTVIGRARAFAQDILELDLEQPGSNRIEPLYTDLLAEQWGALTLGVADFVSKAKADRVLIGLSGGMDSALVAAIAASSLDPENVAGVLMPSQYTSEESVRDALALARNLGIRTFIIPIEPMFAAFRHELAPVFSEFGPVPQDLTEENLQARIRGVTLMALANRSGALVLNTGNKSEAAMGYSTLYGDTVGALAVIGDLFKTEVYRLARWFCDQAGEMLIPQNIFEKEPSAELRPGQKDTDSLPPYAELDPQLDDILRNCLDNELARRVRRNEFKRRQCPPPLLVSGLPLSRLSQPQSCSR